MRVLCEAPESPNGRHCDSGTQKEFFDPKKVLQKKELSESCDQNLESFFCVFVHAPSCHLVCAANKVRGENRYPFENPHRFNRSKDENAPGGRVGP